MKDHPSISVVLDRRRVLKSGKYPVRLQAVFKRPFAQKRYQTGIEASESDFKRAMGKRCPELLRDLRKSIKGVETAAEQILNTNDVVTVGLFERLFMGSGGSGITRIFDAYIKELDKFGQIGSRDSYKCALNSFTAFGEGQDPSFVEITEDWIKHYAKWMKERGRTTTTVGIYLRNLRKIYNDAIDVYKILSRDYYPFGKRRYKIQAVRKAKHSLSIDQKNQVLTYESKLWQKSADFWVLSYLCNGMNMTDVAYLLNRDIDDNDEKEWFLSFDRTKIETTTDEIKKIVIPLREEVKVIIARWRSKSLKPDDYLFPILEKGMTPAQQKYRIKDFIKEINGERIKKKDKETGQIIEVVTGLKAVAQDLKFKFNFTTYTARHTFSNISRKLGASDEHIQEALGHESINTTRHYLKGFDIESKKKMSAKL